MCVMQYGPIHTSHLMSGYRNFIDSLHHFRIRGDETFLCGFPNRTYDHLLMECPLANQEREKLKLEVGAAGAEWPCDVDFMTKPRSYSRPLSVFAHNTFGPSDEGLPRKTLLVI
ncbi:unnamed protein product [Macrosiphum euphorbiae]|uniref:Reverse transcriptase n=1 Tax=Macrosiphum euphorbiae TaxID=13131 RepID=A0AAV0XWT7_9HEMI|nr:unnamed protein product [Macrosiphum euphorbiae]